MIRKLITITGLGLFLIVLFITSLLLVSPFYVYSVFNQETAIAQINFQQIDQYQFLASLSESDFCVQEEYLILGDQFQLDAGFAKWKGPGVLLGFKPRYRLDRLSGRYKDTNQQNELPGLAHNLAPDLLFDIFTDVNRNPNDNWLIDTTYGSSIYLDIDPLMTYTVFATEDGLILRTRPILEYDDGSGNLIIDISQACADSKSSKFLELIYRINQF